MSALLDSHTIEQQLSQLQGWQLSQDRTAIEKKYLFRDFPTAFSFMTRVAFIAEKMNHHPNWTDRKSTRLNSSHRCISYAVFCLKKKTKQNKKKQKRPQKNRLLPGEPNSHTYARHLRTGTGRVT